MTHAAEHFFKGVCICPCVACTRSTMSAVQCVCPACDSRLCGARTMTVVGVAR